MLRRLFIAAISLAAAPLSAFGQNPNCNIQTFCASLPNSTGAAAQIGWTGSCVTTQNDLVLTAQPVPPGEPGIFYYGYNEIQQPFGDGFRCVGQSGPATIFRLFPFAVADAQGLMSYPLNQASPPTGGQISPGDTIKFQAWFRDPAALLSGFNLSDGLSITFQADASALQSDDFDDCGGLDSFWTFVDTVGDSTVGITGVGTSDAQLIIDIPGGLPHDAFDGDLDAPRLLQAAPNTDFTIEAKFEDITSQPGQFQGLMIVSDLDNWMRFDFLASFSGVRVFAASTENGTSTIENDLLIPPVPTGDPLWLRVRRVGDNWTQSYSMNGTQFTGMPAFSHAIDLIEAGIIAGNSGTPSDPHTVVVDYFFDTAAPISPEDSSSGGGATVLTTAVVGSGTIDIDPDQTEYLCDDVVTLTALAPPGWIFDHWEDDLTGNSNPETIAMSADRTVTAVFVLGNQPPTLSSISASPTDTTATITWNTNMPATSQVDYGTTPSFGDVVLNTNLTLAHSVELSGLQPGTSYLYKVTSENALGLSAESLLLSFQTPAGSGLNSDDFNSCLLNNMWIAIDPLGDSSITTVGAGTDDAVLRIDVPGGTTHDWFDSSRNAPRVVQVVNDYDFQVEIKFDSIPDTPFQIQGFIVEETTPSSASLRFDYTSDDAGTRAFVIFTSGIVSTILSSVPITPTGTSIWMRITRQGNLWTQEHSSDGANWLTTTVFAQPIVPSLAGLFAGNVGTPAPAFSSKVDYFSFTPFPPVPEDGMIAGTPHTLTTTAINGSITIDPEQDEYFCNDTVTLTALPDLGWQFDHWNIGVFSTSSLNPLALAMSEDRFVEAVFVVDTVPPVLSGIVATVADTTATVTWTTNEPATSEVDWGPTSSYGQSASDSALVFDHSIQLTGLDPSSLYHFQVTSMDSTGLSTSSGDMTFTTDSPAILSDDFNSCSLASLWSIVDPQQDATIDVVGAGTPDAFLRIEVPAGLDHDAFDFNTAPRVVQPASDVDFQIEVKFESDLTAGFQSQGILIEETVPQNAWMRFDFFTDGVDVFAFAAFTSNNTSAVLSSIAIPRSTPHWMRVTRQGDQWTQEYSSDGTNWTVATTFNQPLNVSLVGVFAGNAGDMLTPAPAHTALVDYFFYTPIPIVPEDGPVAGLTPRTLTITTVGNGSVDVAPDQTTWSCDEMVTLTAIPDAGWVFDHWEMDLTGSTNPETLIMDADRSVTAVFVTAP